MSSNDFREEAEEHWSFLNKLFEAIATVDESKLDGKVIDFCHFLYVEAMVHGYKHGKSLANNNPEVKK